MRRVREFTRSGARTSTHHRRFVRVSRHRRAASGLPFRSASQQGTQEAVMTRSIALLVAGLAIVGADRASAQSVAPAPGTLDVTLIPAGGTFFTSTDTAPSFGNYTLGAGVTYNITRLVGVEGEVDGTLGRSQD